MIPVGLPTRSHDLDASPLTSFTDAVATFRAFLRHQGAPDHLVWVFREDVTSYRRRIWVRFTDVRDAGRRAALVYDAGRQSGFGVSLAAVCRVGAITACCVWVPRGETEASYAMLPRTLKCSVPTPLPTAVEVRSAVRWNALRWLNRHRALGNLVLARLPDRTGENTCGGIRDLVIAPK